MNNNNPLLQLIDLSESSDVIQSGENTFKIIIETNIDEYLIDPTGLQTLADSYELCPPREINLPSTDPAQILAVPRHDGLSSQTLSDLLMSISEIIPLATDMGLRTNDFGLTLRFKETFQRVYYVLPDSAMDKEACSICFKNLPSTADRVPTRMSCSHVFHYHCISPVVSPCTLSSAHEEEIRSWNIQIYRLLVSS